ncbi:hypothetical protein ANCCAN_21418 [Ancylostoma caninum]|uniref:Uncharacterized protein n=1 Tax=Ancylostoma caninum TaxID=29170 RepID=A0A368FKL8_ANCCA|nr:hypothetical protein ANCCAN_21418 [Ancylostoma caninum]
MSYCALSDLKHSLACSKIFNDMFELANIASISEEECWSNSDKERELRKKNSQYMSPYGIALAIDAHRKRCPEYHRRSTSPKGSGSNTQPCSRGACVTIWARCSCAAAELVNAEIDYNEALTIYVYDEWSKLAKKLIETQRTPSIITVWPDKMPESRAMRQLLIALERHQQTGGSLMFFLSLFEDNTEQERRAMADTCAEFVRYITDPSRRFEALVRDHYSGVRDSAPYTHPVGCLGTEPRFKKSPLSGRQIRLYLEKMRLIINDVIKIKEFDFASAELKERRRKEKLLKAKRRHEEHMPNFYVIQDPERRRHDMNITFRAPHERRRNSSPTMRRPHGDQAKRDCRSHSRTRSGEHCHRAGSSSREPRHRDEPRSSSYQDDQRHSSRHEHNPRTSSHRPDDPRSRSHRRDDKAIRASKENPRQ